MLLQLLLLLMLIVTSIRVIRTPRTDSDRVEKVDFAALILLLLLGTTLTSARDRYTVGSAPYWYANIVLLPICLFAIRYAYRLFQSYRNGPRPQKSKAIVMRPPKLDPPAGKR